MSSLARIALAGLCVAALPGAALATTSQPQPYVPPTSGTATAAGWSLPWNTVDLGTCSLPSGTAAAQGSSVSCAPGSKPPPTVARYAFGSVWVAGSAAYMSGSAATFLQAVNPTTQAVSAGTMVQGVTNPKAAVQGGSYLWLAGATATAANGKSSTVVVGVDSTGTARKTFKASLSASGASGVSAAYGGGSVWVGDSAGRIYALSPSSGKLVRTITTPNTRALAVSGSYLWAASSSNRTVRLFKTSNGATVKTFNVTGAPTAMVLVSGNMYVFTESYVYKYNASSLKQTLRVQVPNPGIGAWMGATAGPGGVWASCYVASILRFNTSTGKIDVNATWSNSNTAGPITSAAGALWVPDIGSSPYPVGHGLTRFVPSS